MAWQTIESANYANYTNLGKKKFAKLA